MRYGIGKRVGAIMKVKDGVCYFFGYGTYRGEEIPTQGRGIFAEACIEAGMKNSKIELDNGKVIYGCECWWADEESTKKRIDGYNKVVEVDIDKIREDL